MQQAVAILTVQNHVDGSSYAWAAGRCTAVARGTRRAGRMWCWGQQEEVNTCERTEEGTGLGKALDKSCVPRSTSKFYTQPLNMNQSSQQR